MLDLLFTSLEISCVGWTMVDRLWLELPIIGIFCFENEKFLCEMVLYTLSSLETIFPFNIPLLSMLPFASEMSDPIGIFPFYNIFINRYVHKSS